jgi:hypothetical protein
MSLLITSNDLREDSYVQDGGQMPQHYTNYLDQPLKIAPNSEIALCSAKIRKNPTFLLKGSANKLYFWWGEKLDSDPTGSGSKKLKPDTTSQPLMAWMRPPQETDNKAVYTAEDFAEQMTQEMNGYLYHPNLYGGLLVVAKRDPSTNDFEGFEYQFTQRGDDSTLNERPVDWVARYEGMDGFTYDTSLHTFTKTSDTKQAFGLATTSPISWSGGYIEFGIAGMSGEGFFGLSRSFHDKFREPPYFETDSKGFWDYAIELRFTEAGDDREVYLWHSVVSPDDPDKTELQEIVYYGSHTGATSSDPILINDLNIISFNVHVIGERINFNYRDSVSGVGHNHELVHAHTQWNNGVDKKYYPKPCGQTTWALYPQIKLEELNDSIEIQHYGGIRSNNFYNNDNENIFTYYWQTKNIDWWFTQLKIRRSHIYAKEVDTRYMYDMDMTRSPDSHEPVGQNAGGGIGYSNVMILKQSQLYYQTIGAQAHKQMGFKNMAVVDTPTSTTGSPSPSATFTSNTIPSGAGVYQDPIYVRIANLPVQSYNAVSHQVGQIIGFLPQSDNQGNSEGSLMFNMEDRIYIDINNPSELQMNNFDIQLVDKYDRLVQNLTGSTQCIFHIRPKK